MRRRRCLVGDRVGRLPLAVALALAGATTLAACGGAAAPAEDKPAPAASRSPSAGSDPATADPTMPKSATPSRTSSLPVEEVAKYPLPGTNVPHAVKILPDGDTVTYLWSPGGDLTRQLYAQSVLGGPRRQIFNPPEGGATEDNLSEEEKLRRERMRERGLGVTSYAFARDSDELLVPVRGDLYVQAGIDGVPNKIVDTDDKPAIDARMTRDGTKVAYVQDDELYIADTKGGAAKQITSGARGTGRTHGLAEYIAQEEMGRHTGYWWSFAGDEIAYTEVDETHIPTYRIVHQGKPEPQFEDHGYPFAGADNAKVKLGVVAASGGATKWVELTMDGEDEVYLARVHWMPDGRLLAELQNRDQTRLDLVQFDLASGKPRVLLTEQSDVWINLHGAFHAFEATEGELAGGFLWASESTGFRHLAVHDRDGKPLRALTSGEWMVDGVECVDEDGGFVYFTGTKDGPTEHHLYRVPLGGGEIAKLTLEPGSHGIAFNRTCTRFVDTFSDLDTPPRQTMHDAATGKKLHDVFTEADPRVAELALQPPRLVTLKSRDGVELHGAVYEPDGPGPHPTIVSVYGGPHAQRVTNSWGMPVDMRAQYLRGLGYLVFKLDNRGSARRGLQFEGALRHDMGNIEVADQVDGVNWLVEQGLTDEKRVGIYGWSYGGYMSAMALAKAPETFQAAVAGAPVTSWDGYDTHYTERYMSTPAKNPKGYADSSVLEHVEAITGKLMLVHGLIDENVHFRHTARLINALIKARKPYELLMFPDERHMPRGEADRIYMEERIAEFFDRALSTTSSAAG